MWPDDDDDDDDERASKHISLKIYTHNRVTIKHTYILMSLKSRRKKIEEREREKKTQPKRKPQNSQPTKLIIKHNELMYNNNNKKRAEMESST